MPSPRRHDVLIVGGGNAALCAAITARRRGATVLLVERAPREWRGGNSKYTRNVRIAHNGRGLPGRYSPDELVDDLVHVTGPELDRDLASFVAEESQALPGWMERNGIRWQKPLRGTVQLARTNRFFLGGGKALVNSYYRLAQELGVEIRYGTPVVELTMNGLHCSGAVVETEAGAEQLRAGAVVVASGGFEANIEWLREHWGDRVDNYTVRGSACNDGSLLRNLLELGAQPRGNPRGHHAVAVDARAPKFEGGIVTRVDSIPFSIVVNRDGERFADEGADLWPRRYATWGGLIGDQPEQRVYSVFDSKVAGTFLTGAYEPVEASTLAELARRVGLPPDRFVQTVDEYNRCVVGGTYDPGRLDGCTTAGLEPPKSNWALRIDQPPYGCFTLVPGITFTYLAVAVDRTARVQTASEGQFENVYAAGEIMAGNILRQGYLAGIGMTIGSVFGIVAGEGAARHSGD